MCRESRGRWAAESRVQKAIHDAFVFVDALGPHVKSYDPGSSAGQPGAGPISAAEGVPLPPALPDIADIVGTVCPSPLHKIVSVRSGKTATTGINRSCVTS